ncbi:MAG: hypothetical protein V4645_11490 [Pseudomonadota bacterium]
MAHEQQPSARPPGAGPEPKPPEPPPGAPKGPYFPSGFSMARGFNTPAKPEQN